MVYCLDFSNVKKKKDASYLAIPTPIGSNDCPVLSFLLLLIKFGLNTAEPGTADLHDIIHRAPSPDRVGSTAHGSAGSAGSAPPARPEMVGRSKPGTSTPSTNSRQGLEAPVCRRLCSSDGPRLTRHHHHHHHRQRQVSRPLGIGDSGPRDEETARSVSFLNVLIDLGIQIQTHLTSVDEDITSDHHHHHHGVYGTIGPPVPSNPYTRTKSLGFTKKTQP